MDVVVSCAESRDRRGGREKMRALGGEEQEEEEGSQDRKGMEKSPFH